MRREISKLLRRIAARSGIQLYTATSTWPEDPAFRETRNWARANGVKGIPDDRCFFLLRSAQAIVDVPGDLFETGCRAGLSSNFLLEGTKTCPEKILHGFDSFEGLSAPGPEDSGADGEAVWKQGALASGEEVFLRNTRRHEQRVRSYKGWIPSRFPEVADRSFALVHVDVDLYQPTLDSLEFAYPRTSSGGIIICDDYGSRSCPGARKAVDEFFSDKPEMVLELPASQSLVVKR